MVMLANDKPLSPEARHAQATVASILDDVSDDEMSEQIKTSEKQRMRRHEIRKMFVDFTPEETSVVVL